ncbi:haloacid dehalogenase-like hydrolase [Stenotrophomonas sp. 278]|uniref:haloacid dehalogenase-like hydrolase n=1 Tax=Stenotrophomonas sp. 278 TaxID=2479851 RepID=UPI000F66E4B7|nr:haloacid dehalogenase-like hydrolase [Stenotrophomonas sp. 278]RRU15098.1 phosphatidylglycerophosphatase C [Stenotrophomonas sp. 278]
MKADSVFFDLDDTLHEGDLFRSYLLFLAKKSVLRLVLLLPLVVPALVGYLICPDRRWSVSFILWILTVLTRERSLLDLDAEFSCEFSRGMRRYSEPYGELCRYIECGTHVYVVSGSPESLVRRVYGDLLVRPEITLIGSRFSRFIGGRVLQVRCVLNEKVRQIQLRSGYELKFKAGYSDSEKDGPVLGLCAEKYRVNSDGMIERWPSDSF